MTILEIILIGIGLSMDAFAVSITNGLCCTDLKRPQMLSTAVCFGLFQGLMPVIGFFLGKAFEVYICAFDHWIALVLLGYIGGKMILDAVRGEEASGEYPLTLKLLITQGIATSIDALAVGVSFAALPDVNIWTAAVLICCTTFAFSLVGVVFGKRVSSKLGSRAQLAGGIILVGIGVKIFAEHMFFAG
jgi:putative Mn2+ efflux pump MntP